MTSSVTPAERVLLLNPLIIKNGHHHHFLSDWTGSEYPSSLLPPPMEFLYLHAVLSRAGVKVEFLDASARHLSTRRTIEYAVRSAPDLIVCAATFHSLDEVLAIVGALRSRLPKFRIALFGTSLTAQPRLAFRQPGLVDFVVLGEPEKPVLDLATGSMKENLAYWDAGDLCCLPRRLLEPLDWLPHPSRHLLRPMDYIAPFSRAYPFTTVITSRGCPYAQCTFCSQIVWAGARLRQHGIEYVLEELAEGIDRYGYREIFFRDQVFTFDRQRTLRVCESMLQRRPQVPWRATTRVTYVDAELLTAMRRAGCYQISYGFESSSQEALDQNRKGVTLEQAHRAAVLTRQAGMEVVGNFVIGLQSDTRTNLSHLAEYAIRLGCDFAQFQPIQTWHDAGTSGALSNTELISFSTRAYQRFYLRPAFIFRMLKRMARPRLLLIILRSAWKIIMEPQIY